MYLVAWFLDQKLSDWLQGLGSLAAAGVAVGIALRQERNELRRAEAARVLRRHVLAAAISPILRDMRTAARFRSGVLQSVGRPDAGDDKPHMEELLIHLPDIFMSTIRASRQANKPRDRNAELFQKVWDETPFEMQDDKAVARS